MQLSTHFGNLDTSPSAKREIGETIEAAVERYHSKVRKIHVSIRDTNGPRGGEDKKVRCVVHLKRMSPIVISETGASCRSLINRVAERLAFTINERMDRVKKSGRSRKSRETQTSTLAMAFQASQQASLSA